MEDEPLQDQQQGGGSSSGDEEEEGSGSSSGDDSDSKPKLPDPSIKPNDSKISSPLSPNAKAKASVRKASDGGATKRKLFEKPPPPSSSPNDSKEEEEEEEEDDDDFVYLREAINRSDNKRIKAYVDKGLCLVDRSEAKKLDREFRHLSDKEKYYDIVWYRMVKEALKLYLEANGKSG